MKEKVKKIILVLLVIFAFILRIWGTAGVYPRPDDHEQIGHAKVAYNQYFQHYLSYPVFYQYVGGFFLKGINLLFQFFGAVEKDLKKNFSYDEIAIILRIISALYGAFSVYITYLIGRKIFDEKTALLSSFFLTFTFFHILLGHTALLDPQMGFLSLVAFYFILKIFETRKYSHYIFAGLFTGLSIASKYNAIFICFSLLLAHIFSLKEIKKPWKVFNFKIMLAGIAIILGFLIGNPPVWLSFRRWYSAFKVLPIVLKPDPWMAEIKGLSLWDWLRYNKFTFALININYSIKLALSFLLLIGFFYLIFKLKKSYFLFLSFPIFYIILGLGIYEISRPRDHFVLIPFYIILASKGFFLIYELIKKTLPSKTLSQIIAILLLALFSYPSLKSTWEILCFFRERDTLEFSEDWIYENIPPKSWNTYELYTPFIYMPASVWKYGFIFPYRYHHNFYFILGRWLREQPFDHLRKISRFVYVSSVNSNRFKGVEKFYPKEHKFYTTIQKEFKILKRFSLREIESKNPEISIYSIKKLAPRELSIIFPNQLSLHQRERDVNFAGAGDYGKTNLIKLLYPGEKIERCIVKEKEIEHFSIFLYGKEGDSILLKNYDVMLKVSKEGFVFKEVEAKRAIYPSPNNFYLFEIEANYLNSAPVLVKIIFDPLKIGFELFKNNQYERSISYFLNQIEKEPENLDAFLYLQEARRRKGLKIELPKTHVLKRVDTYFRSNDMEKWMKWVERYASIDTQYLLDSKTLYLETEDFTRDSFTLNSLEFLNRKGSLVCRDLHMELPFILPQNYIAILTVKSPYEKLFSSIEIVSDGGSYSPSKVTPLPEKFFKIEIPFEKTNIYEKAFLRIKLNEPFLILDDLRIIPDLKRFLEEKRKDVKGILEIFEKYKEPK